MQTIADPLNLNLPKLPSDNAEIVILGRGDKAPYYGVLMPELTFKFYEANTRSLEDFASENALLRREIREVKEPRLFDDYKVFYATIITGVFLGYLGGVASR